MVTRYNEEGTPKLSGAARRASTVFPHISRDAKRLKVSRHHLWSVLTGRRQSASLLRRYQALKQSTT